MNGDTENAPRFGPLQWLALEPRQRTGLRVLQIFLGAELLFRVLTEWPFALYFWGPAGIGAGNGISRRAPIFGNVAGGWIESAFHTNFGTHLMLALLGIAAIGLIVGRLTFVFTALALVSVQALDYRLPLLIDGGDTVAGLVLIYLLFTLGPRARYQRGSLRVWLHNLAVAAIGTQTVIVYFVSGLAKAHDDLWQNGVALYYVSQVGIFSNAWMQSLFQNPLVVTLATYAVLFWELMFPLAVMSRFRRAWIVMGLLFEVSVACLMGLVTFAIVMTGLLLFLVTDDDYARCKTWLVSAGRIAGRKFHSLR